MYEYNAVITSVYDGDTCTATIDLGFKLFTRSAKLRLIGINTPEMRGGTAETKAAARAAKEYLVSKVLDKEIRIKSEKKGKYGRYLCTLWCFKEDGTLEEESINDQMIRLGHAIEYMR